MAYWIVTYARIRISSFGFCCHWGARAASVLPSSWHPTFPAIHSWLRFVAFSIGIRNGDYLPRCHLNPPFPLPQWPLKCFHLISFAPLDFNLSNSQLDFWNAFENRKETSHRPINNRFMMFIFAATRTSIKDDTEPCVKSQRLTYHKFIKRALVF